MGTQGSGLIAFIVIGALCLMFGKKTAAMFCFIFAATYIPW